MVRNSRLSHYDWQQSRRVQSPLVNIILEDLANTVREEKDMKGYTKWERSNKTVFICRWNDYLCKKSYRIDKKSPETIKWLEQGCRI